MALVAVSRKFVSAANVAYAAAVLTIRYNNLAARKAKIFTASNGTTEAANPVVLDGSGVFTVYADDRKDLMGELRSVDGLTMLWRGPLTVGVAVAQQPVA